MKLLSLRNWPTKMVRRSVLARPQIGVNANTDSATFLSFLLHFCSFHLSSPSTTPSPLSFNTPRPTNDVYCVLKRKCRLRHVQSPTDSNGERATPSFIINKLRFAKAKLRECCSFIPRCLPCVGGTQSICKQNSKKIVPTYINSNCNYKKRLMNLHILFRLE